MNETLVFIHGSDDSAYLWRMTLPHLTAYTTLALDLPGHGALADSPGPAQMSVANYAAAVREELARRGVQTACLVGHSLGAAIALRLAVDAPALVRRVALVGGGARLRVLPALLAKAQSDPQAAGRELVTLGFAPEHAEQAASYFAQRPATAPGMLYRDLAACDGFDMTAELPSISQPTLALVGAEDRLTPPKYATFLAERMPNAQAKVIPGAGHYLPIEAPETLAQALDEWLQSA